MTADYTTNQFFTDGGGIQQGSGAVVISGGAGPIAAPTVVFSLGSAFELREN